MTGVRQGGFQRAPVIYSSPYPNPSYSGGTRQSIVDEEYFDKDITSSDWINCLTYI
jgi:hypothetical protein